jgi:hypothetical protein
MLTGARQKWRRSIRKLAHELLLAVDYTDVYGRNIGLEYSAILAKIRDHFPNSRTSRDSLRKLRYEIDGSIRVPARLRTTRAAAQGYAAVRLLATRRGSELGTSYSSVRAAVRRKFPDQNFLTAELKLIEKNLVRSGFTVPPRPH